MVAAFACHAPNPEATPELPVELHLPEACSAWRPWLAEEMQQLWRRADSYRRLWPRQDNPESLRLVVVADAAAARRFYRQMELSGDPAVPRTFPDRRLAVIPLPRLDALLVQTSQPPRSLRETLRHEAVHLWSLDAPALRASPLWFQEGFAELLASEGLQEEVEVDAYPSHPAWQDWLRQLEQRANQHPQWQAFAEGLPAEGLLECRRWVAEQALLRHPENPEPWIPAANMASRELLQNGSRLRALIHRRGREIEPPDSDGKALLVAAAHDQVACWWPATLQEGTRLQFRFRLGRTGVAEGGLHLRCADGRQVRLRMHKRGLLSAYLEDGALLVEPLQGDGQAGGFGAWQDLQMEVRRDQLRLQSGSWKQNFSLAESGLSLPLFLEFYVFDGALQIHETGTKP